MYNRVRQRRIELGMSIRRLAHIAELTRITVRSIERQHNRRPNAATMESLARALGANIGDLFWTEPDPAEVA